VNPIADVEKRGRLLGSIWYVSKVLYFPMRAVREYLLQAGFEKNFSSSVLLSDALGRDVQRTAGDGIVGDSAFSGLVLWIPGELSIFTGRLLEAVVERRVCGREVLSGCGELCARGSGSECLGSGDFSSGDERLDGLDDVSALAGAGESTYLFRVDLIWDWERRISFCAGMLFVVARVAARATFVWGWDGDACLGARRGEDGFG
jgi:hypothetical protein